MAFIFGGNTGLSYEEMLRQRDLATQLAGNVSRGGYTALGSGLASGLLARRADKAQKAGSAAAQEKAQSVLGTLFGQQVMGGQQGAGAQGASFDPSTPAPTDTLSLIKGFEGYSDKPYWDVNAHRAGYGSDTVTMSDGSVVPISPGMSVNRQDAERDLQRRVSTEFEPIAAKAAGAAWEGMAPNQRAALTSIAYNYGEIPKSVASALQTPGIEDDVAAIQGLASHNGGVNAKRRAQEAQVYAGTAGSAQTTMSAQNAPQQVGADPAALIAAMSDPYLDEGTRSILGQLFQAQIQKSDPSYQMGMQADQLALEKAQLDLDKARQPDPGYKTLSPQDAKRLGLADGGVYQVSPKGEISVLQKPPTATGDSEYGLNPIMGVDENGNKVVLQLGKDGSAVATQFPEGITPDMGLKSRETAKGTAEGKAAGEDAALLESVSSKMPGLEQVVSELDALAETATYTIAGQARDTIGRQFGMEQSEGAIARAEYIAKVDNQVLPMLRDTFGAAFTVKEGETLRATLGDPDKSPQEKQAVLRAFIEQKRRDVEALANRVGGEAAPKKEAGTGTTLTYNPQTGDFE